MSWRKVDAEPLRDDPSKPPSPEDFDYSRPVIEQVTMDFLWAAEDEWNRRPRRAERV
jgi:hypothetical protein